MRNLLVFVALSFAVGCTSPERVIVWDVYQGPVEEWRCPLCKHNYTSEYFAQKCINKHRADDAAEVAKNK